MAGGTVPHVQPINTATAGAPGTKQAHRTAEADAGVEWEKKTEEEEKVIYLEMERMYTQNITRIHVYLQGYGDNPLY